LLAGQDDGGDCCGVGPIDSLTHFGCCNLGGAITASWTVSVSGNNCCRDAQGACIGGSGACDGSCGGLP